MTAPQETFDVLREAIAGIDRALWLALERVLEEVRQEVQ